MTIEEKLVEMLYESGLFKNQAVEIVERAKANVVNESMQNRWQDQAEGYPPQLLAVLWVSVKDHALEWIDENCPQAWFRPLFDNDNPNP